MAPAILGELSRVGAPVPLVSSKVAVTVVASIDAPPAASTASGVVTVIWSSEATRKSVPASAAPPPLGWKLTPVSVRSGSSNPEPLMVIVSPPSSAPPGGVIESTSGSPNRNWSLCAESPVATETML